MARLHTDAQAEHLRDVTLAGMSAAAPTGVGAKLINYGGLEYYGAFITSLLPAILIKPFSVRYEPQTLHKAREISTFRIVFVRAYDESTSIVELKVEDAQTIVEAIWDDWNFPALSLSNGQMESLMVAGVEYEPREDLFAFSLNENMSATAVVLETRISTDRKDT